MSRYALHEEGEGSPFAGSLFFVVGNAHPRMARIYWELTGFRIHTRRGDSAVDPRHAWMEPSACDFLHCIATKLQKRLD
jgi:hypothetical protein